METINFIAAKYGNVGKIIYKPHYNYVLAQIYNYDSIRQIKNSCIIGNYDSYNINEDSSKARIGWK